MNSKQQSTPPMGPDQDEDTLHIRQFLINCPKAIHMLSDSKEGRQELRKHQKIATEKLRSETDWREASFAAWMLLQINKALGQVKRKRPKAIPKVPPAEKALLASCYRSATLIQNVLWSAAWEYAKPNGEDMREACMAASRIVRATKEYRQ